MNIKKSCMLIISLAVVFISMLLPFNVSVGLADEVKVQVWGLNIDKKIILPDVPQEYGKFINMEEASTVKNIDGNTLPVLIITLTFENDKGIVTLVKYEISKEGLPHDPEFTLVLRNRWVYQFGRK